MKWKYDLVLTMPHYRKWRWTPTLSIYDKGKVVPINMKTLDVFNSDKGFQIVFRWGQIHTDISIWKDEE